MLTPTPTWLNIRHGVADTCKCRRMHSRRPLRTLLAITVSALASVPSAHAISPTTTRASLTATGAEILGYNALPSVSADGRWLAFDSYSDAVVAGDANGTVDVFLRDMHSGSVRKISQLPDGTDGNQASAAPSMSADGRYIAFISDATNLAPGINSTADDVYVYDRVANTLRRVSTSLSGKDGAGISREPRMAADGKYLTFESTANDLVAGDPSRKDIFLADVATLALQRVSVKPDGGVPNSDSYASDVSDGGRFVAFSSFASDLVAGDLNGVPDMFVRDMAAGTTTRQSVSASGGEGNATSERADITADGCYIAFYSTASNLVTGSGGSLKAMVRNRCNPNTEVASLSNSGVVYPVYNRPVSISDDACTVVFVTGTAIVTPAPGVLAVILRDRCQGITTRADVSTAGDLGNANVDYVQLSAGSGRYVVFDSGANNLVPGDAGGNFDVFIRDRANAAPPIADLQVTVSGRRATVDATGSRDPDNRIASATIAFGDGSPDQTGLNAAHDYTREGTFSVTLVVTDGDDLTTIASKNITIGPVATGPLPPDTTPRTGTGRPAKLVLSGGVLSALRFKPVARRGKIGRGRGATLLIASSEAARFDLLVERAVAGRRVRGKCKADAEKGAGCRTYKASGRIAGNLRKGDNTIKLTGRAGAKALRPGRYRLRVTASAADGRRSGAIIRAFTISRG